jgi:hypothetical protein
MLDLKFSDHEVALARALAKYFGMGDVTVDNEDEFPMIYIGPYIIHAEEVEETRRSIIGEYKVPTRALFTNVVFMVDPPNRFDPPYEDSSPLNDSLDDYDLSVGQCVARIRINGVSNEIRETVLGIEMGLHVPKEG